MSDSHTDMSRGAASRRDADIPVLQDRRKKSRNSWLWLILILLLAGCLCVYLGYSRKKNVPKAPAAVTSQPVNPATNAPSSASAIPGTPQPPPGESAALQGALGLALQGVSLFSGEKGAELWRLKASYAHMTQEGNEINVDVPVVRYTMGEPGVPDYLDVKSDKGKITDNQRFITLWGNVDVKRFADTVTGPKLEYDSQTRVMLFPEGASMDGPKASGEAGKFTWDLSTDTMIAENGITVVIKPQPDNLDEPDEPDTPDTPNASGTPKISGTAPKQPVPPGAF